MDLRILLVYGIALVVVAVLAIGYGVAVGWRFSALFVGEDGVLSTSKFQWFLWTVFVIFGYAAVFLARVILKGDFSLPNVTPNILVAIGLSGATAAVAKGVTTGYISTGRLRKATKAKDGALGQANKQPGGKPQGGLFTSDTGTPDLSKVQLLAWTFIAIGIFLINLWHSIPQAHPELPDIDASLLVLMGLGQAAYIGTKLTATTVPRLTGLSVDTSVAPPKITIDGQVFGDSQDGGQITFNGTPIPIVPDEWKDTHITFAAPAGGQWKPGTTAQVGIIAGGQPSANTLPYTFP